MPNLKLLQPDTISGRLLRWLIRPRRIPLLFSVTIIAGIFYHYAPKWTPVWILLSLVLQAGLFRLFDYMKQHKLIGSIAYLAAGAAFLSLSVMLMRAGAESAVFAPEREADRIPFWVWFFTPQSVLVTDYPAYTVALFLMFTFFISSIAYYFTLVRYRVLMSFVVMIFPFAIYAKENETMPVLSIIILLFCYFAVMIYCRQAHAENEEVVQTYQPDTVSTLSAPSKRSPYAKVKPEILDGHFLQAAGIFLAASSIFILALPKPNVKADRTALDTMVDLTRLSDYLENAISGFADTSDGGNYSARTYTRTLYYGAADEPANLRVRTFTDYDYLKDTWNASSEDGMLLPDDPDFRRVAQTMLSASPDQNPDALNTLVREAAALDPAFAEKWQLSGLLDTEDADGADYMHDLRIAAAAASNNIVSPTPLHTSYAWASMINMLYQNRTGIVYCSEKENYTMMFMESQYFSDQYAETDEAQALMRVCSADTWPEFLADLYAVFPEEDERRAQAEQAIENYKSSALCREADAEEIPDEIRALAAELTEGKTSDLDKARAIFEYLHDGNYTYSLDAQRPANVTAFLFKDKAGVCYQFATAMAQLCRAAGLPARYVEGYMMAQEGSSDMIRRTQYNYVITTNHAHAFCDVYIAGYGWMMMDATASSLSGGERGGSVLVTLQFAGLILFAAGAAAIVLLVWLIPMIREKLFRRKFRKNRDAASVQAAFARLRKQWKADPAKTARVLCEEQSSFLHVNLSGLLADFERTVYANRCTPETADRVYRIYCAAYDAYKPAVKRERKQKRAARKNLTAENGEV